VQTFYNVLLVLALVVALAFALLVFITGKGDAMSGGGSVRTTFKGKASFEDFVSRMTLYLGIGFMVMTLALDLISNYMEKRGGA
jgi:protein translocase SecG subunit